MNFLQLASPSLGLPQTRLRVRRDFNVKALINVGSGYIDLVSGRPCTLTGDVQRTVGPSGRRFNAAVPSVYAESPTGLANGQPVTLVAVSTSTSGLSVAGISNTRGSWPSPKIECTAGALTATCKVSGGTGLSVTGPTVTVGKTYAAALHWRPGVGLKASFNGGEVQLASHSATTLYLTPATLWMGGGTGSNVYMVAALAGELSDTDLRALSNNPWSLFDAEDHPLWWPSAAGAGVEASGPLQSISLAAPDGSATGAATASAALPTASLSAPTGAATGSANTGGSLAPLSLSAPAGSAAGAATASASLPTATLSAPTGTAVGACLASGAISGLSIAPPTGTAFSGAGTVANGVLSQISLSAPTGGATGNAAATGALQGISLSASLSSASGAASCSGALPTISITPCSGSASTAVPASRASGSVFCRIDTPRAVVRIATSQCTVRVP